MKRDDRSHAGRPSGERWQDQVGAALGARLVQVEAVAGGDINQAFRGQLADGRVVFVKTHATAPADLFRAEARGLAWLRGEAVQLPEVLAVGDHFLVLQWLELQPWRRELDERFGRELARLHQRGAEGFGLDHDNYLATLPQANLPGPGVSGASAASGAVAREGSAEAWPEFFIERRLRPFARHALRAGRLPALDARLDGLRRQVDRFGPPEPPARLHGDLWWGNVGATAGRPVIFDPAAYGGHREIDLAMLAWAGGLPDALTAAYQEVAPLAEGWRERLRLWQLLPLIAHAALFGGSYSAQVMRALAED